MNMNMNVVKNVVNIDRSVGRSVGWLVAVGRIRSVRVDSIQCCATRRVEV